MRHGDFPPKSGGAGGPDRRCFIGSPRGTEGHAAEARLEPDNQIGPNKMRLRRPVSDAANLAQD